MDDKLAGALSLRKTVVLTGWNGVFSFSIGYLVTTTVTAVMCDGFFGTDIYDKLALNLALVKTVAFVATIVAASIGDGRDVLFFSASLGDGLSGAIGS